MNPDSLRYALRRLSNFRFDDVFQRLKIKVRHENLKRRFRNSPKSFTVKNMIRNGQNWIDSLNEPSEIRKSLINSSRERLGCLNLWSQDVWDEFGLKYRSNSERLIERGRLLLNGKVTIFGWLEIDFGNEMNWLSCFDRTRPQDQWPQEFYWMINFSDNPLKPLRDIKLNWELNRLQFLLTLGACWRLTGERIYSQRARSILYSWLDSDTYPLGPSWSSNLEVALRSLSLVRCCLIFADSDEWDDEFLLNVIASIELHLEHLENELTTHHTEGNHLLGESAALLQVSLLCPFLKRSDKRIQKASQILNKLIPRLILPDGVYAEQSTSYAKFVLEFLIPLLAPKAIGHSRLSVNSKELTRKCVHFLDSLSDTSGMAPMIGDSDSGSALGLYLEDFWDVRSLLFSGALVFKDPELLRKLEVFPAGSFLFWGREGYNWYESNRNEREERAALSPVAPLLIDRFTDGGLVKVQHKELTVIFDVGPLGKSPGFEHGHSDGLSVQLWIDGYPILVDPGTYVYNGNPKWRKYFKGSSAHNVLILNQCDQSRPLGSFRWAYSPRIDKTEIIQNRDRFILKGSIHLDQAVWTRRLFNIDDSSIVMLDEMECQKNSTVVANFVFDPSWRVVRENEVLPPKVSDWIDLILFGWEERETRILYGSEQEMGGWLSRLYGQLEKTCSLRARSKSGSVFFSGVLIGKNLRNLSNESMMERFPFPGGTKVDNRAMKWFSGLLQSRDPNIPITGYKLYRLF